MDSIIKGLIILNKYGSSLTTGHETIYAGPPDLSVISPEDKAALEALGWYEDTYWNSYRKFV